MNTPQRDIQLAVMCLQELDAQSGQALSFNEISQRRAIPLAECTSVIQRLSDAGIVELAPVNSVVLRRPVEQLTALDIVQAVWKQAVEQPTFQIMAGTTDASNVTAQYIHRAGTDSTLNG